MQFNLFTWIREGVRQSVLLGVSDAVTQIGTPYHDDGANARLQELLLPAENLDEPRRVGAPKKRLGRSLKDIDAGK